MFESIRNIFSIPELRKRVIFTLLLLAVYRIGGVIPNPGLSASALAEFWQSQKGGLLGFIDLFSGRNMSRMTIFALGIMPYISSSIILQLLTVVWPTSSGCPRKGISGGRRSPSTPATARSSSASSRPSASPSSSRTCGRRPAPRSCRTRAGAS